MLLKEAQLCLLSVCRCTFQGIEMLHGSIFVILIDSPLFSVAFAFQKSRYQLMPLPLMLFMM